MLKDKMMKIKEIEKTLNRKDFKLKVEDLFDKEISEKIDFDFKITVSLFSGDLLKISAEDASLDTDGCPIPKLFAIVSSNPENARFEKQVIKQFFTLVEIFENGYFLNEK